MRDFYPGHAGQAIQLSAKVAAKPNRGGGPDQQSTEMRAVGGIPGAAETSAFLNQRGVDHTSEQQTKTKKALQYFSKRQQTGSD